MSAIIKEENNTTLSETPVKPNNQKNNTGKANQSGNQEQRGNLNRNNKNKRRKNFNKNHNFNNNNNNNSNSSNNNNSSNTSNNQDNQNSNLVNSNQNSQLTNQKNSKNNDYHHNHHNSNNQHNKNYDDDNRNHYQQNGTQNSDHRTYKVILGQPTLELPQKDQNEVKKFTGRCRIFVANLPNNTTEESLKKLFEEYGEVSEVYLGKSNFAFVKMDTRLNAEKAKNCLDGKNFEGRVLRVRLAAHAAALRVKNLSNSVTNELLEYAFSYFGEVERAIVITDDRGRSIGEGIVEFARKFSAQNALKRCSSECFLLTSLPKPVYVEPFEQRDEEEGFPEKQVNKNSSEFRQEREIGPRFAEPGSFEHEYSVRWKKLIELENQKKENLKQEISQARKALQEQLEYSRMEHQTKLLREQLREMEERADKFGQSRNIRLDEERRLEEERQKQLIYLRQQEEEILRRSEVQDVSNLRRQENDLRSKANALQHLLDKQEQAITQVANPVLVANDQSLFTNRLPYNDQIGQPQQLTQQQPIYNTTMQMMPNVGLNNGMDFNRFGPAVTAGQPSHFAGQSPMSIGLNGPYNGPRQVPSGQLNNNNHRFANNNNANNVRNFPQGNNGQSKRMRRF